MVAADTARTILVTGAGRGLGRVLAERLAARGDRVVAHARSAAALEGVPCERALVADLEDPAGLADAVAAAGIERLDALVHNAGVLNVGAVAEESLEWWHRSMTVNVVAPAELTRLLLPALRAARGHVLFLNSGAGLSAAPRLGSYAASKHALRALADSLRAEERGNGLRVTSFYPSHFDTDMQRDLREQYGSDYDRSRAMSAETVAATILGVLDAPEDMVVNELRVEPPNPLPVRERA
ncbi:SDR family oxidoreductase [Glycomyces paridis]|uniref:SDR family oxidoreductase n=1 Tax=Glycomyces paridis TaxID=2126555 RepID=A0A4S8PKQ6_9ACTN|nr:SDR family oxidoreductase [Glycomyces paridis]THV31338.1 SDR family oxidoreductase [Glycomyces paridis]